MSSKFDAPHVHMADPFSSDRSDLVSAVVQSMSGSWLIFVLARAAVPAPRPRRLPAVSRTLSHIPSTCTSTPQKLPMGHPDPDVLGLPALFGLALPGIFRLQSPASCRDWRLPGPGPRHHHQRCHHRWRFRGAPFGAIFFVCPWASRLECCPPCCRRYCRGARWGGAGPCLGSDGPGHQCLCRRWTPPGGLCGMYSFRC